MSDQQTAMQPRLTQYTVQKIKTEIKGTEGLIYNINYIKLRTLKGNRFLGQIDPLAITVARCLLHIWHMKVLKGLGNKKYLNTYSKIHQIASAADQLASKINGNSSASRQNLLFSWMWPAKSRKNNFFAAHTIGNHQHDDAQNKRSLGTNLSRLNENENGWKRGLPYWKMTFFKKK